ncbi:MAG: hypothetical protein CBD94_01585 [Gammaproteobacteria bacterium TMED234]|nr:MAG: hypothetical protein CBD94_01585 [Gammaproteobacteria bacterium TMED234]
MPEFLLPDIKLPEVKKFPEPVIDYLAPKPPDYPTVLVPSYRPGKANNYLPKVTPKGPVEEPKPEKSVAEKIVEDVVDAVQPSFDAYSGLINLLRTDLDKFKLEVAEKEQAASEVVNTVSLPGNLEIPIPKPEILVAAGTTATISVAATLTATAVFKKCVSALKPIVKQIFNRVQRKLGKKPPTWSRQRLAQRRRK